jgi:hypothetical protein
MRLAVAPLQFEIGGWLAFEISHGVLRYLMVREELLKPTL